MVLHIWATLARNFVPKGVQKSPNLVTLNVTNDWDCNIHIWYRGHAPVHTCSQRTLTIGGSFTRWMVSSFTSLHCQLLHNIQIITYFLFLSNPIILNCRPSVQWSFPLRWLFSDAVKSSRSIQTVFWIYNWLVKIKRKLTLKYLALAVQNSKKVLTSVWHIKGKDLTRQSFPINFPFCLCAVLGYSTYAL